MEQNKPSDRKYWRGRDTRLALQSTLGRIAMGEIRATVRLENYADQVLFGAGRIAKRKIRVREIDAVVDTGAVMTLLPQDLVDALGLKIFDRVIVQLANDQKIELDQAAAFMLTVAKRSMITDCLVGPPGCVPLIGQLVMERLDLIADPARRTLTPRPESPFHPTLMLKRSSAEPAGV